jgi:hypothetical protein
MLGYQPGIDMIKEIKLSAISKRISTLVLPLFVALAAGGCSSTIARKDPGMGAFPEVKGTALNGTEFNIPSDIAGAPAILMVGFVQKSQFDIDRWMLGLRQLDNKTKLLELPTIRGILPGMASNFIDSGMRRGIPEEDWSSVVTIYSDSDRIVNLTGNENPNNARVFLLDGKGQIRWFFDLGYSADRVMELHKISLELR